MTATQAARGAAPARADGALRRCAFLTMADRAGYFIDDELAHAPLGARGWRVEEIPWQSSAVDWRAFDAVVIRSAWDYYLDPPAFLAVLAAIERAGTRLENPAALVRWNLDKSYLADLERRGVAIVPTVWRQRLTAGELAAVLAEVGSAEVVVKPVIGANAAGAFRIDAGAAAARAGEVEAYFAGRALMAQPLATGVLDEGEYSLVYFDGALSHAVRKAPQAGDFRVQEEHGGEVQRVEPEPALRAAGAAVMAALAAPPLYARADLVRANGGAGFWLMELEVVEPSLYLRLDPAAPERFAAAIDARLRSQDKS